MVGVRGLKGVTKLYSTGIKNLFNYFNDKVSVLMLKMKCDNWKYELLTKTKFSFKCRNIP